VNVNRKLSKIALATVVPVGLVVSFATMGGTAWAKPASGTVKCTDTTSLISFKPALTPNGTSKEKSSITGTTLTGCTVGTTAVTVSSVTVKIKGSPGGTNSCASFATSTGSDTLTLKVKWAAASPTTITFGPGTIALNSTDTGFNATGGTAKGSYAGGSASFDVVIATADINSLKSCIAGTAGSSVAALHIVSGTSTV
jgi:hypothetical protein